MVKPYTAVGLIPTVRGIRKRADIKVNLEHLSHLVKAASWLSGLDLPVRLIAFPEGALQAFNDEVLDLDHVQFARECAIDIPGDETEALGEIARQYDAFIMAQAKARHPDLQDRFFNVGFILNPKGEVILKHYKVSPLFPVEHSVCPHDIYDWWIEKYGRNLDAFWPVVDTEIGRLGIMMANEGSYPENARALAMNGAEVVYRASYPHPATGNDMFEIQSRARALDNNMYLVAPVVYPTAADNCNGPLVSRLRCVNQPVTRPRIGFSASRGVSLPVCRPACPAPLHDHFPRQPVTALGAAAPAARDRAAPLSATTRDRSSLRPLPVYPAAITWLSHGRGWVSARPELGASWHGAARNCSTPGTTPAAGVSPPRLYTAWRPAVPPPRHAGESTG